MSMITLMPPRGNAQYYTAGYRRTLEDHLHLVHRQVREQVFLDERRAAMYKGDFYGLMIELGVKSEHHWGTLRANGFFSPDEFMATPPVVNLYDPSAFAEVLDRYLSTRAQL